jgi:hypothetical protein
VYIDLMNESSIPLPITDPVFTPSKPFISPPQLLVAGGATWHMRVQLTTTITVSAPEYGPTVVDTFGPGGKPEFIGTNPQTPIEARLSHTFSNVPGLVQDLQLQDGDVLVFYPADLTGAAIDAATGGYGYSHCGLACVNPRWGYVMIDVDDTEQATPQVEEAPLTKALQRGHVAVRFGLTETQAESVCACAQSQLGDPEFTISGNTLTVDLCTTLILDCMNSAGFNLNALGLGGVVVSPNQIAQTFGAARGVQYITGFG